MTLQCSRCHPVTSRHSELINDRLWCYISIVLEALEHHERDNGGYRFILPGYGFILPGYVNLWTKNLELHFPVT